MRTQRGFIACVTAGFFLIALGLHVWGAAEVRENRAETISLSFVGAAWLVLATMLCSWLGVSLREDVIERKNGAAFVALCGALIAFGLIYAGGSFGEGPSFLNNVFSAGIGTVLMFALWTIIEATGKVSLSITEERDLASGIRCCGFLISSGLVIGRAVAGDWHSVGATVHDCLADGWPAFLICAVAVVAELFLRPSRRRPFPPWLASGLVPAFVYLGIAIIWLWHLGPWEGMPK